MKELRVRNGMTLRNVSEETKLSVGFLSQIERGKSTIAVDGLVAIAKCLGTNISYFVEDGNTGSRPGIILRSYEREVLYVESEHRINFKLANDLRGKAFLPRMVELLPAYDESESQTKAYAHKGEEFLLVMEGVLSLIVEGRSYEMYPGDSAYFDSQKIHMWRNNTNKTVRLLTVHTPNPFASGQPGAETDVHE
jgi:transcriptional regulator with XRE-family HTH domain